ncbi:hypothetical protein H7U37_02595 [Pseudoflavonifractor phocaeensis]|nr:hypothetical protein [Pseudoflavonifractor phocaeensis]
MMNGANWIDAADTAWYETQPDAASFELHSPEELAGLARLVNAGNHFSGKTVTLTGDIDLAGREWTPIGGGGTGGQFRGDFDGRGHTISNLKITRGLSYTAENKSIGLFGATQDGEIRDFTLYNAEVTGSGYVAAVVGGDAYLESEITGVHVTGSVRILGYWYAGGILGNGYTTVANCSVTGDGTETSYVKITGGYVGGIVGYMGEGNCVTTDCAVKDITVEGAYNGIGGVNGILHYGNTIRGCTVENVAVWQNTARRKTAGSIAGPLPALTLTTRAKIRPR